jgi:CRISPR/Cas system CMR-associated protein Cmr1 (group 7 of RAMP superfamily)
MEWKIIAVGLIWGGWEVGQRGYSASVRNSSATGTLGWFFGAMSVSCGFIMLAL